MPALYRKYRPQRFDDLVGQTPIKVTLQHELTHNRVAHAYLFAGPRGVGKTTTARLLAMEVNTQALPEAEREKIAREILEGKSIDVIEIDAASHTGVDNVRENIIENARFTPQYLTYKVFIIDEVHMLSTSSFNALLKTLEEPPAHVIFILATTELHRVPETIISRCQRFDFKRVSVADLAERLEILAKAEQVSLDADVVQAIARRADGSVRDAEVLLGQLISLGEKKITLEQAGLVLPRSNQELVIAFIQALVKREPQAGLEIVERLITDGVPPQEFIKECVEILRFALLYRAYGDTREMDEYGLAREIRDHLITLVKDQPVTALLTMMETLLQAEREMRTTPILQLPLEMAVMRLVSDDDVSKNQSPSSQPPAAPSGTHTGGRRKPVETPESESSVPAQPTPVPKKSAPKQKNERALSDITKKWSEILDAIGQTHRSIGMSLKVGIPYSLHDNRLTIAFQHAFHAERTNERNVKARIQDVIQELTGMLVTITTAVIDPAEFEKYAPAVAPASNIVQDAVAIFGGEVVAEN
ncbi:MAG: DNA polymerase III subunit gamma/tau [Candidatus Kerfeldbacteria bacterium]|nr:DNA polymerase III subunit gamma/tau [Candidatus Kerfeldbacteria bacterium]